MTDACFVLTLQVDYANASTKFLGWVVASYSFGQLVASPFFGLWADVRPTREPLVAAFVINIVFNVLYSYLGVFKSGIAGWVMIASRILVGFGAGVCVCACMCAYAYCLCICRHRGGDKILRL